MWQSEFILGVWADFGARGEGKGVRNSQNSSCWDMDTNQSEQTLATGKAY